ncbi:MAG: glycosyltransferase family 2 protein [Geminicoccaceae bacterium]
MAIGPGECELTILMPCLDEAETLAACIRQAAGYLERTGIVGEVVIADNGSTDGSQEIAESHGARVVAVSERGYGAALVGGIRAARGCYVIMGDSDGSYDFSRLDAFVAGLREGYDLVVGNRFKGGIAPGAMPALHRYLGNPVLTALGRLFFGSPVGDFHCGLRGFRRDAITAIGLRASGMEFASEMVVKAALHGLRVTEVPTTLSPDGRSRRPHLRSWRDGWRHLRFLLLFSPRWLFLYPGILLLVAGCAVTAWLLLGPQRVGDVVFDVNSLVYSAAAIICGFQSIAFWLLAKVFAVNQGLLPSDPTLARLTSVLTLEIGVLLGLAMVVGGLAASVYAVDLWRTAAFGALDPTQSLRVVVPAATVLILGLQIMFASFFLSVLGLNNR